ncbi:hypothetical protein H1R20_g2371, partial [Candolleomyces eurysporus]
MSLGDETGSEYHASEKSDDVDAEAEPDHEPEPEEKAVSSRGRRYAIKSYVESSEGEEIDDVQPPTTSGQRTTRSSAGSMKDEDEEEAQPRRLTRRSARLQDFVVSDEDEDMHNERDDGSKRRLRQRHKPKPSSSSRAVNGGRTSTRITRRSARHQKPKEEEKDWVDHGSGSSSADGEFEAVQEASSDLDLALEPEPEPEPEDDNDGRPYAFRQRQKINYAIPPPLESLPKPPPKPAGGGRNGFRGGKKGRGLGWSASGAELGRWMGMPGDDSDSDHPTRTPRKPFGLNPFGTGALPAGGIIPGDLAAAGTPSNLGKIGDAALADADPLGPNQNVTFDEVGGLDEQVFQRFNVVPPRGVLFHGPPGTGKTLLARALAASSRSGGRQISFFMRKGADCLSKWVGEAERQLRLLFEEARNSQPSIIFFDEIDGLAPVRSSKQDQIHASIVSTLLALMDGMDGRGQVIVIGATNRPDAVDPALRRPGRFDREFYFGLPSLDAREKILGIMTRKWSNWDLNQEGEKGEQIKEKLKGLAKLTKGYGGADLRFEPLLSDTLERVKNTIQKVMPLEKPLTALEEAEFEDEGGEEGALEREMLSRSMQTLRVYRPRVIIHGPVGMGQGYIGAAALHHLEGYHIQSLELGTLMSDSGRTVEAAIVQLFVEAKRHQPSVIYIPSLFGWCAAVNETSRSTVRAMLETLLPTDPILLLAVVDGPFSSLPRDVKAWFGPAKDNRVELAPPAASQRSAFFEPLLKDVARKPNEFADGVKRRKRILEELPIAPPLEPRQPTAAELAVQAENDQKTIALLKFRLGPILAEMKRKFKRFTKRATEEYNFEPDENGIGYAYELDASAGLVQPQPQQLPNGVIDITGEGPATQPAEPATQPVEQVMLQRPPLYDMDLDKMHGELYKGYYLTPQDFLDDVGKMVHNADVRAHEDLDRLHKAQAMFTAAQVSLMEFDPAFRLECERMAARERQRAEAVRKAKGKDKEHGSGADTPTNGVQTRRSTRINGAPAELITMTDPVKLERRLKRQREAGENSGAERDTSASAEEGVAGGEPNSKRTKMDVDRVHRPVEEVDDMEDELHLKTPQTQNRHTVRFANSLPQIVESGQEGMHGAGGKMPTPSPLANYQLHHQQHGFHQPQPDFHQGFPPHQQQHHHNGILHPPFGAPPPQPHFGPPDHMNVDRQPQPRSQHGFDPFLLNPVSPTGEVPNHNSMHLPPQNHGFAGNTPFVPNNYPAASSSGMAGPMSMGGYGTSQPPMPMPFEDPNNPFSPSYPNPGMPQPRPQPQPHYVEPQNAQQLHVPQPSQVPSSLARTPSPNRLTSILRASRTPEVERQATPNAVAHEGSPASEATQSSDVAAESGDGAASSEPTPMVVERSPSPPLPDFQMNEELLQELRDKLQDRTGSLTIEQLEQLRATCLGEVWRQRKEWDRDPLVRSLLKTVDDFLDEVKELEDWDNEE